MITLHRIALPLVNAFVITAALLYAMHLIVHIDEPELLPTAKIAKLKWPSLPEETPLQVIAAKPTPPKQVEVQPDLVVDTPEPLIDIINPINTGDFIFKARSAQLVNPSNSQLVLALGYPPSYPNTAISRGIEGYVVVGFSVDKAGHVFDAFIIEAEPQRIFDKSALKAIKKFRYKAKIVNDKPAVATGQRYLFRYEID